MPAGRSTRELQVVDAVLTQIARQYGPQGFIYDQICPTIKVDVLSGLYPVYDDAYFFGDDVDNKVADRAETPEIELSWSTSPYLCEDYALKVSITPRDRAQAHPALRLEMSKTKFLMSRMAQRRERRLAAQLRKTTNGGQLNLGGAATTPFATSTAIEADWKTAKTAVYSATGFTPNVAVVPYLKAYDMATNTTLRDIFKYQVNADNFIKLGNGSDGEDIILPRVFHGTRLIIPKGALYNTAREGATKSLAETWGSSVRFLYVDPEPEWGTPGTCYSFSAPVLTGNGTATGSGPLVDRWSQPDPRKDYIRATECVDERVCAPDLGYELTGC